MTYKDPLKKILEQTRWYWDHEGVRPDVRTAFRKVLQCRTPALGAEVFASHNGELTVYHTCKSRACPSCGHWATMKWQHERQVALPSVLYRGITFSMPDALWRVFRENRSLAEALPALAAGAIKALITAKYQLRAGIIAILHTFNGRLGFNSHVHTMVTAGGWQVSSRTWVHAVLYTRGMLMPLWRSAVLGLLRAALRAGVLTTEMKYEEMEAILVEQERWWSVKVQPLDTTKHFLQYAGRYALRPPIAQRRISYIGDGIVQFSSKDKKLGRSVEVQCSIEEFIDSWSQHIPKRYQHAIRYFGVFAPRAVSQTFDAIFSAISHKRQPKPKPPRWADSLKQSFGHDPLLDQTGQLRHWARRLAPQASL
jgi:Putative transposase/Transposase zinc-binding domain